MSRSQLEDCNITLSLKCFQKWNENECVRSESKSVLYKRMLALTLNMVQYMVCSELNMTLYCILFCLRDTGLNVVFLLNIFQIIIQRTYWWLIVIYHVILCQMQQDTGEWQNCMQPNSYGHLDKVVAVILMKTLQNNAKSSVLLPVMWGPPIKMWWLVAYDWQDTVIYVVGGVLHCIVSCRHLTSYLFCFLWVARRGKNCRLVLCDW